MITPKKQRTVVRIKKVCAGAAGWEFDVRHRKSKKVRLHFQEPAELLRR